MKNLLKYTGIVVVAVVVGIIVNVLFFSPAPAPQIGAGVVNTVGSAYPNGFQQGSPRPTFDNWTGDSLLATSKTNQFTFKNTTGGTLYFDSIQVSTTGFASSTYKIYAYATSSAPSAIYDWTAPTAAASTTLAINGFKFATSSNATTTSSFDKSFGSNATLTVPANSRLNVILVPDGVCTSAGVLCETATSSKRGFDLQVRAHYHD